MAWSSALIYGASYSPKLQDSFTISSGLLRPAKLLRGPALLTTYLTMACFPSPCLTASYSLASAQCLHRSVAPESLSEIACHGAARPLMGFHSMPDTADAELSAH